MDIKHIVAVIGGACSGSEAAFQLASHGIEVVVLEQNTLPYGKIEDGLPRWHDKLQAREIQKIDDKLANELVHFVPQCHLGREICLQDVLNLGFSAVILANGAWKDRQLEAEGVEEVEDLSFCYQNPLIFWFNHYHEKHYDGPQFPVKEGAAILGGGLASIDVAKVCQLETVCARLNEMGIATDVVSLEHKSIVKFLEEHGLTYEQLNVKPATLYYRRRIIDMPISPIPPDSTPERIAKAYQVREKIIANAAGKFFFRVEPLRVAHRIHSKDGSVCGITLRKTRHQDDKLIVTEEEEYVETSFIVSSIGSIPEPIPGITMRGEIYDIFDTVTGRLKDFDGVYGIGNAVTGKGNIQVSYKHAKYMGGFVADALTATGPDYESLIADQEEAVRYNMREIFQYLMEKPPISQQIRHNILNRIRQLQQQRGYEQYTQWRDKMRNSR